MQQEHLCGVNLWLMGAGLLALFAGATLVGMRLGARQRRLYPEAARGQINTIEASLLGLLALLLGFTFAMAMSRYETRKQLLTKEVNAIDTAWLRSQLMPGDTPARCAPLFRAYVDNQMSYFEAKGDRALLQAAMVRTGELHEQMWKEVRAAAKAADTPVTAQFVAAMNDLIDAHTSRLEGLRNHVPEFIFILLAVIATAALAMTGFSAGLGHLSNPSAPLVAATLIAALILLIVDLDRPWRGLIQVSNLPHGGIESPDGGDEVNSWPESPSRPAGRAAS